jgi:hypothetical protein
MAPETDNAETRRAAIRGGVPRCKKTEAGENDREPENQNQQEWERDGVAGVLEQQQTGATQVDGHVKGLALQRALRFTLGREFLDLVIDSFEGHGRIERRGPALVCRPKPIEASSDSTAQ